KANQDPGSFTMHEVIRKCCQSYLETDEALRTQTLRAAVTCVGYCVPSTLWDNYTEKASRFEPHVKIVAEYINEALQCGIQPLDAERLTSSEYQYIEKFLLETPLQ